jgi:F-type H+-transporting ATPase subunit b
MESTLNAVGQLLVQALPTFFIVLFLHVYLKRVFFKPLARVLAERNEATEGARKRAAEALDRASRKTAEYEEQIRQARNEIYREQEEQRRRWREEQAAQVLATRRGTEEQVARAKADLAGEAEAAMQSLRSETDALAREITRTILQGKAA